MFNDKKGQVSFFLIFLFLATIIVLIGAIAAPFGSTLATEFYGAGEELLLDTQNGVVADINDVDVRNALNASFVSASNSAVTNIEVANSLYEFSWLFVLILTLIVLYLVARQTVAFSGVV